MRGIKCRGKSTMTIEEMDEKAMPHTNGWVYGSLVNYGNVPYIVGGLIEAYEEYVIHEFWCPVESESVGQYAGLKDKNGTEIYEGDYILGSLGFMGSYLKKNSPRSIKVICEVVFKHGKFQTVIRKPIDEHKEYYAENTYRSVGYDLDPLRKGATAQDENGEWTRHGDDVTCYHRKVIGNIYENKELLV